MQVDDEVLDLVDDNDNVIGTMLKTEFHNRGLHNCRSIHAFIKNNQGKLWIPRRAGNKSIAPLALDASVSGHVSSGESYEEGLFREALEELNLNLRVIPYKQIAYLTPAKDNVFCFEKIYEITLNKTPSYNKEEIVEGYWLSPGQLRKKITQGEKFKSDIPKLLKILYS